MPIHKFILPPNPSRFKNLSLPGDGSYQTFLDAFNDPEVSILVLFISVLNAIQYTYIFIVDKLFIQYLIQHNFLRGDLSAIERISYEFCQSQSEQEVIYTEARYTPHYFLKLDDNREPIGGGITLKSVVEAANRGIARGEKDFNVTVRTILSCRRGKPQWCREILELVTEYQDQGVVGIDLSGDVLEPDDIVFADGITIFKKNRESHMPNLVNFNNLDTNRISKL